jgi:pimeloyl-ACP methyl ester carboxylesterase
MDLDYIVIPALIMMIGILIAWLSIRRVLSLRRKSYFGWRKFTEYSVLSLVSLFAAFLAASSGFNAIALNYFRHPPPGQMYSVDGNMMRIDCTGSGSPTIILEAGGGEDGLIWSGVQPGLAKTTRVCSYDRAGMGWSDALPPPRDADHVAAELHGLLASAGINDPIVLMGASRGGIYIRDYATRYPTRVAGLIFVDSSTPLQQLNPAFKAYDEPRRASTFDMLLNRAIFQAGIPRLLGGCSGKFKGFDTVASKLYAEDRCHQQFRADRSEEESLIRSGEETVHTGPYGSLPILIFSHDPATELSEGIPAALEDASIQMRDNLKKLSTHSRLIIVRGSGHRITDIRPELIERDVPLFIEQIRGKAPEPINYGSTTIE